MPGPSHDTASPFSAEPGLSAEPGPAEALSYEQARDELVRVVAQLEQGSATLEESIALWERGEALARVCEEWLIGAKARLDAARAGTAASEGAPNG
ncbi:MAG: exodeoxyribonuclease VII small subunit [Microbacteriaceae bacterium]|nr:MAG: exodeoxyribonuclease VII small subunit [Microbacteriaceae bacterium]